MGKQYRPWAPEQSYLLPPSPLEWLPEGHLAFFILEVVRELDLVAIENALQEKDPRGERPYAAAGRITLGSWKSRRDVVPFGRRSRKASAESPKGRDPERGSMRSSQRERSTP